VDSLELMSELQPLRADHAPALLDFEVANRDYFATSISDRGDEFFEQFTEVLDARLAEQEAGSGAYYVLVADEGLILARVNLMLVEDGVANLGYRVAQHVAGRGVATSVVREVCEVAAARHGIRTVRKARGRWLETARSGGHGVWSRHHGVETLHSESRPGALVVGVPRHQANG
jgi:ribosomal-protein-alanine N-acetyltransferase